MNYRLKETKSEFVKREPLPWKFRDEKRQKLISDYIKTFQSSSLWLEAQNEKWDSDLYDFLHALADTQAQFMVGERNIGYRSAIVFGYDKSIIDKTVIGLFLSAQKRQAEMGYIDVSISTGRIQEWKQNATRKTQQEVEKQQTQKPEKEINPGIDEYIQKLIASKSA